MPKPFIGAIASSQRILGNAQSSDEKLGPLRILSETSRAAARQKGRLMRRQPKAQTLAPLAGNRGFESTSLRRRVCEPSVPQRQSAPVPAKHSEIPDPVVADLGTGRFGGRRGENCG